MFKDSPAFSGYSINNKSAALDFYGTTLGCEMSSDEMGVSFRFPNGHQVFLYEKSDHQPASFTVLNFPVENIDAAVDMLTTNGVAMELYDSLPAQQDEKGVLRGKSVGMGPNIAWFKDPAGNVLSVLEKGDK